MNSEIERLEKDILDRTKVMEQLDKKRSELMQILNTQGALKEYTEIQRNYNNSQLELNEIKAKLDN